MGAIDKTTRALLQAVRDDGTFSDTNALLTDARLIRMAQRRLEDLIYPLMHSLHVEYFVATTQSEVTNSTVDLPTKAMANKLRYLKYRQNGNSGFVRLPQLDPADLYSSDESSSRVTGFYFEGNKIVIYPPTSADGTVEFAYYLRPNNLVAISDAGQVESINSSTGRVTLSNLPSTFTTGTNVCAQDQNPPFKLRFFSRGITNTSNPNIFLADVSDLQVGDWICLENEAVIPEIPSEMMPLLYTAVVQNGHDATDATRASLATGEKLKGQINYWVNFYKDRSEGNPIKFGSSGFGIDGANGGYFGGGW